MVDSHRLANEADAAYERVIADPRGYSALTIELLEAARSSKDPEALVAALRARAWSLHAVMDNLGARRLLDEAVAIAARHGLQHRLGEALVVRAVTQQELGRPGAARRDLARASTLVTGAAKAQALLQLAVLDHNAGAVAEAAAAYRKVLEQPACPPDVWVKAANNLSNAETQLGRPRAGLAYLERAGPIADGLGPLLSGCILNSRAWSSFHAGLVVESLRLFPKAAERYAEAGVPLGEHYLDFSDALVDLRLLGEAQEVTGKAMRDLSLHGARLMAAEAQVRLARLALATGDPATAAREADGAAAEFARQRRPVWAARARVVAVQAHVLDPATDADGLRSLAAAARTLTRSGLAGAAVEAHLACGRLALRQGRVATGLRHLAEAQELAIRQPLLVRLRGHLAGAFAQEVTGTRATVLAQCRRGLADLAAHRAALPSYELRALAAGHGAEFGRIGLRALLPDASPGVVLAWMERTRAVTLLRIEPAAPLGDDAERDLSALRAAESELRVVRREEGSEPRQLVARIAAHEASIRRASWAPTSSSAEAALAQAVPVTAPRLRERLGSRWLVALAAVDGRLVGVALGPRRAVVEDLGPVAALQREHAFLMFAVRRMRRGGARGRTAMEDARQSLAVLADSLVRPLGVPVGVELVVVPSRELPNLPWALLHDGPTTVSPSAALWVRCLEAATRLGASPSGRVVVIAGPGLPGAAEEVTALGRVHPQAEVLTPGSSSAANVLRALQEAGLVHLACHGRLRGDSPLFSSLELSDGPLTLHELFARGCAPAQVVLAACHGGSDVAYEGDEVIGFASALLARGTVGVIAAAMPLPDGVSVPIMTRVHEALAAGMTMATALRAARLETDLESPESFVAWCALSAFGAG